MREWLYGARVDAGLTMKQLSEKLCISESYYSLIEGGTRQKKMDISLISKLSDALCLPLSVIVDYENSEREKRKEQESDEHGA